MFEIVSAKDFLQKLKDDLEEFNNDRTSSRIAINSILTAYHLHEWVWGEFLKVDASLRSQIGITGNNLSDFANWLDNNFPHFEVLQSVANGSKHFIRQGAVTGRVVSGWGDGPYGIGPWGEDYLLVEDLQGNYLPVYDWLKKIEAFWDDFFENQLNV